MVEGIHNCQERGVLHYTLVRRENVLRMLRVWLVMLFPVNRRFFRWSTPDPNDNWVMNGHLVLTENGVIMVDPPNVPGLIESVLRLGKLEAVILTTGDHIRGTEYISGITGAHVYIPKQEETDIDSASYSRLRQLRDATEFDQGESLPGGIRVFRARVDRGKNTPNVNEVMLLTGSGELLAGDLVMGASDGRLLTRTDFFFSSVDTGDFALEFDTISRVIGSSGAKTLLASHGFDIVENLQDALKKRGAV